MNPLDRHYAVDGKTAAAPDCRAQAAGDGSDFGVQKGELKSISEVYR